MECKCESRLDDILTLLQNLQTDVSQVKVKCNRIEKELFGISNESEKDCSGIMENTTVRQILEKVEFDLNWVRSVEVENIKVKERKEEAEMLEKLQTSLLEEAEREKERRRIQIQEAEEAEAENARRIFEAIEIEGKMFEQDTRKREEGAKKIREARTREERARKLEDDIKKREELALDRIRKIEEEKYVNPCRRYGGSIRGSDQDGRLSHAYGQRRRIREEWESLAKDLASLRTRAANP